MTAASGLAGCTCLWGRWPLNGSQCHASTGIALDPGQSTYWSMKGSAFGPANRSAAAAAICFRGRRLGPGCSINSARAPPCVHKRHMWVKSNYNTKAAAALPPESLEICNRGLSKRPHVVEWREMKCCTAWACAAHLPSGKVNYALCQLALCIFRDLSGGPSRHAGILPCASVQLRPAGCGNGPDPP